MAITDIGLPTVPPQVYLYGCAP